MAFTVPINFLACCYGASVAKKHLLQQLILVPTLSDKIATRIGVPVTGLPTKLYRYCCNSHCKPPNDCF